MLRNVPIEKMIEKLTNLKQQLITHCDIDIDEKLNVIRFIPLDPLATGKFITLGDLMKQPKESLEEFIEKSTIFKNKFNSDLNTRDLIP